MSRIALLSFRFPRGMVLLWTAVLLLAGSQAFRLDSVLRDHGLFPLGGQYAQVQQMLAADFDVPDAPVMLLFEKADGISNSRFRSFIEQALVQARGIDGLTGLLSPLERQGMLKGNYAYALLSFSHPSYRMQSTLDSLKLRLPTYDGITVKATGKAAVQADVNKASHHDLAKAELIGIPLAFFILWLVFRNVAASLVPIMVGVAGVAIAMGIMYGLGTRLELSNFVWNVIPMVGLALSIDFSLMVMSRFREELGGGMPPAEALAQTMRTAGRAVFVSAACVFLGLLSFVWIPLPMFSSIAIGAMTAAAVSLLLSFTLLPALLALCLPAMRADRVRAQAANQTAVWEGIARFVMRRPAAIGLLAGGALIALLLPLGSMKAAIPDAASLPQSYDSRAAAEAYRNHFEVPASSKVWVIAEGQTGFRKQSDWTSAYALTNRLARDPSVIKVESVFSELGLSPGQLLAISEKPLQKKKYEAMLQPFLNGNRMLLQVTIAGEPSSSAAKNWLREWEKRGESSALTFSLGGEAKYEQEVFDVIYGSLSYVLLFLFVSNFIVLFVAFRSVLIAMKTIFLNLLSIGASFGILAWIFADGRLGMEPSGIAVMIPIFICGLVFGISMDYGVFLISRIYEEYRRTGSNEQAVGKGLASVSKIITSAAAIMIAVTAPFAFGEVAGVKQLGIGIAAAIFIDATIVRMLLVPSLMSLLGKWNWWAPGWLKF